MNQSERHFLYIHSRISFRKLAALVTNFVEGKVEFKFRSQWTIESAFASMDIEINENPRAPNFPEWLFYPYCLFADPLPDAPRDQYEQQIRGIVQRLREEGITVIADWEDEPTPPPKARPWWKFW